MIRISVYYDGKAVNEFEQAAGDKEITIGRAPGCSVRLDEASVSRLHAVIRHQGNSWILERKASFGAVLMNGQEVENARLEGGEEVVIGKFSLRIDVQGDAAAATADPPAETQQSASSVPSVYQEDEGGRTKFVSAGVNALFRFEPGSANLSEFLMQADMAVFGRGSNCDVVLTEKKASRKHCELRRQGLSFFVKDLNSANGTMVNGNNITEVELVPGDVIQIGEAKCQFSIENKEYFNRQDQFLPVPSHLEEAAVMEQGGAVGVDGMQPSYGQPAFEGDPNLIPGIAPEEPEPKDLFGKLKYKWFKIPKAQRMRYLTILVVFSMITALLGGPDEEVVKKKPKPLMRDGKIVRTIDLLAPDKKRFVVSTYKELVTAHEKRDFQKMLELTAKILTYVDEYNDTKSFETLAKKGLEEIEEARRQKEQREKQDALRREVIALEEKGRAIFEKALEDSRFRTDLDAMIQEIYSKDPNNRLAAEWKVKIKQKEEDEKQAAEVARQKEILKQKAEDAFAEVERIFKSEKYVLALAAVDRLGEVGYSEASYLERVEKLREEIRTQLASVIDPLLRDATAQRGEGGDLVKAKEIYIQVLKIDGANKEALGGLDSIRETLHMRAKRFYAEAILAESISDLNEAKEKFEKCLRTAPDEDIYKKRCKGKLARYDTLSPTGAN
jgi:pSer/pThr/pTyr-binding forkhead associated (FHA) protein